LSIRWPEWAFGGSGFEKNPSRGYRKISHVSTEVWHSRHTSKGTWIKKQLYMPGETTRTGRAVSERLTEERRDVAIGGAMEVVLGSKLFKEQTGSW
jgi:Uri superfamily endonuclease